MYQIQNMHNLQKHRIKAFNSTLSELSVAINTRKRWLTGYAEVYKFPEKLTKKQIKALDKALKAVQVLQAFDLNQVK